MRKIIPLLFTLIIFSCTDNPDEVLDAADAQIIPLDQMKDEVENQLAKGKIYYWTEATDQFIFSAGEHSDQFYSIGFTIDQDFNVNENMHTIDMQSTKWKDATQEMIAEIRKLEGISASLEDKEILPFGLPNDFPHIIVKIEKLSTISALRNMEHVRFVEPTGFSFEDLLVSKRSSSGCDESPNYNINSNDFTTVAPTSKIPWNFYLHSIPEAWGQSTGDNIRIAIIDTGASDDQDNLGSQFASGYSTNRNITKHSTLWSGSWWWASLDSPDDQCGHGTSMAGLAGAPRSNDGNALGVAYKSNLMTIRATEDVVISSSNEKNGVRDALKMAANRSDVKIISLSLGTPFYSSTVADGIYYAYNKGKLIMAAAGTSLSWTSWYPVIFPANMAQTVAVTGLKNTSPFVKCSTCHSGPEVDFTIIMQRGNDDDRTSLGLAGYSNQPKYIGGSSCATATAAGIAALVWAQNPSASRTTIMNALKNSSQYYPARHDDFGWGNLNASIAANGI